MKGRKTIKLVQAATGAVVLTLLMQLMGVFGYGQYTWMCFLPLLMFFAFGADFKKIPEMLVSYAVGEVWCVINSLVMGVFVSAFGADNMVMSNIVPTILVIFCILTTHENLLEGKICSMCLRLYGSCHVVLHVYAAAADQLATFCVLVIWNRARGLPGHVGNARVLGDLWKKSALFGNAYAARCSQGAAES